MAKPKKPKKTVKSQPKAGDLRPRGRLTFGRPSLSDAASRPAGRSPLLAIRLPAADLETLDGIAAKEGVKRSEMVRRLLLEGIAGYKPGKGGK